MALLQVFDDTIDKSHCRSCHAPIVWAQLRQSGRRMPFDGDALVPVRSEHTDDGRLVLVVDTAISKSHFATCPHAHGWRRSGVEGKPTP
jgi:hypothetical protein